MDNIKQDVPNRAARVRLAVASLAYYDDFTRAMLIDLADAWEIPFKTFVEAMEKEGLIPLGTYDEMIQRFKSVKAIRARVAGYRKSQAFWDEVHRQCLEYEE